MMSGLFLGGSLVLIFLPLMNFIGECFPPLVASNRPDVSSFLLPVDAYLYAAATALAANTVCRSLAGAIFPLL